MSTVEHLIPNLTENRRSNFYYSFLILPKPKREAIETIYTFCRVTDDIVDEGTDDGQKHARLLHWTDELKRSLYGVSSYSLLNRLASIIHRFRIPVDHFYELIKGMEMDLSQTRYGTFAELERYCYRVASTVGLISAEVFGYTNEKTRDYAVNLGIALQLTNILRDIKPDAKRGRIYLPLEDLRRFGYTEEELFAGVYNERFIELMKFECQRAHEYYRRAKRSLAEEDKILFTAARTMGNIYYLLLRRIERARYDVFSKRIRLSSPLKLLVAIALRVRNKFPKNFHRYVRTELPA
ncbi:MAG: presqualene diphosphate synthase HpnD [Bacteroidetes bacterium]|jgi:phytoene synthase|nr:presqualene diphosphate synthase HpnD [Bacteroidota bacterium]